MPDNYAANRENGYRMAQLDLLDILGTIKGPVTVLELADLFQQRLEIRKLTNFTPTESDLTDD